jgi:hypothetical protein
MYGIIDTKGQNVTGFIYEEVEFCLNGYVKIKISGKYGRDIIKFRIELYKIYFLDLTNLVPLTISPTLITFENCLIFKSFITFIFYT